MSLDGLEECGIGAPHIDRLRPEIRYGKPLVLHDPRVASVRQIRRIGFDEVGPYLCDNHRHVAYTLQGRRCK